MLNVYCTGHRWSVMVCKAFAHGARAPIVRPYPLRPGQVFMYGALRGLLPTLRQAQREGRTWYYADNGYFKPGKTPDSYFRVTKNALQHDGSGQYSRQRWRALGLTIAEWRANGSHIVICPPGRLAGALWGYDADKWLADTLATLRKHTDRELRVRLKMSWDEVKGEMRPLSEDLRGAWALVTYSSNAAVEALLAGIPVFATDRCGASAMALSDLSKIETPKTDGSRKDWASALAANQWTLKEMASGIAWKELCAAA